MPEPAPVAGGSGLPPRLRTARLESACVGREPELATIAAEAEAALDPAGGPRLVLIGGKPGIGKTRLAAEAAHAARRAGFDVLYGRSDEHVDEPYQPLAEALGQALSAATKVEGPAPLERLAAGGDRYALFGAVAALLGQGERPLLVVVDDLHWADPPTVLLLEYLLDAPHERPLLFLATYRTTDTVSDEEVGTRVSRLERRVAAQRLVLAGLGVGDVEQLVAGLRQEQSAWKAPQLVRETGGNPLFVSELVRCSDDRTGSPATSSPTIRAVVRQRASALGRRAERTLACAALLGREFDLSLVADTLGAPADDVYDDLDLAQAAGLVGAVEGAPERLAFAHPIFARTLSESLGAGRRGRLHRAAALALEAGGRGSPTDRARHWVAALPPDDERTRAAAVAAGRRATEQRDPDSAARWYAVALERVSPGDEAARIAARLDLGRAQRDAGDAASRETLLDAARSAERRGDVPSLVRAAVLNNRGLVSTAGKVDAERVAVIRAALRACGDAPSAARAELLTTLGAELYYDPERQDERLRVSDEAVTMAREHCDDPVTLARLLAVRCITIWVVERLDEWRAATREALAAADAAGDPATQLAALHWRTAALISEGDLGAAGQAIDRQQELAERLREPTARWLAGYDRANRALLAARLDEAEALTTEALQIGSDGGQPDAVFFYAAHLSVIRYEQGRLAELQPVIAQGSADNPAASSFRTLLAQACLEADLPEEARAMLRAEQAEGFAGFPRDNTWIPMLCTYGHIAAELGERDAAATLCELLEPFHAELAYTGTGFYGSAAHALARMRAVLGDRETAVAVLRAEGERYERIGVPLWVARASLHLGRLLAEDGDPGAEELLDVAAAEARRLGSERVARQATALRDRLRADAVFAAASGRAGRFSIAPSAPAADPRDGPATAELQRAGDTWSGTFAGRAFALRDSLGVRYLVDLLGTPGVERHVAELAAGQAPLADPTAAAVAGDLPVRGPADGDAGPVLDDRAKRAYRERLEELREALEEAERFNDPARAAGARAELDAVAAERGAAVGLGGRDRRAASTAEQTRLNVTRALRRAIRRAGEADADLGAHLEATVSTGTFCAYRPSPRDPVTWRTG